MSAWASDRLEERSDGKLALADQLGSLKDAHLIADKSSQVSGLECSLATGKLVEIVDYDPQWPRVFADLSAVIGRALGDLALRIEHVGSTAVPGLCAKPIIDIDVVISFTFGLGSALAAAGGVLYALNYPSIDPLMGVLPGLKAFVAAVLGGIGNIPGAALGGLLLGIVETFVSGSEWSTYKDAIAFALLILVLLFRPAGLLGRFTKEKV